MLSPEVTVSILFFPIKNFFSLSKQDFFILEEMQWRDGYFLSTTTPLADLRLHLHWSPEVGCE